MEENIRFRVAPKTPIFGESRAKRGGGAYNIKTMINIDEFKKVEIRAGKVLSAEPVEGSEKLLKLSVDFGPKLAGSSGEVEKDIRQVVSGIAKYVSPEIIVNETVGFVANLEPRSIMGLESQAMILAVSGENADATTYFSLMYLRDVPPGGLVK